MNLFVLSIQDFFTRDVLKLAVLPFIITMVLLYILFFSSAAYMVDYLNDGVLTYVQSEQSTVDGYSEANTTTEVYSGNSIVQFLVAHSIFAYAIGIFVYVAGMFFTFIGSIFIALLIIGFLTPQTLRIIQRRHYPQLEMIGFGSIGYFLYSFAKYFFIMLLLFFLLLPFYFIPLIQVVALNLPTYYFFHKLLNLDVASTLCNKEEYALVMARNGNEMRLKTLLLYLFSLIPFAAIFASLFYVIYLGHTYFDHLKRLRAATA